jgi:hypothetical protein
MRKRFIRTIAVGLLSTGFFAGCPWSSSPNVFQGAKGISLPKFGGPPTQTEPPLAENLDEPVSRPPDADVD